MVTPKQSSILTGQMSWTLIYLDTHAVVWLYAGETERFSATGRELIENHSLQISPIVFLELQYLKEIKRLTKKNESLFSSYLGQYQKALDHKPDNEDIIVKAKKSKKNKRKK